ncbi:putative signal peptide-containing protein [Cryptosporidium canis]|uniref:Signal peptide-containing protein n=1 Tax=Cryptosporidium canis TaxID=195482 RepID=A0A9D5HUP6_9CRYT|nr:putative signal peptide-containing protein [Cryptosporidium canis]
MAPSRFYWLVVWVACFRVLYSWRGGVACSVIIKALRSLKQQRERFKPFEERTPRVSKQSELSEFEKRQLYWYYKDFVGRREINKAWRDRSSSSVTDEDIFAGKSFIPVVNGVSKFGQPVPGSMRSVTPASFFGPTETGPAGRSNVIFYRGDRMLRVDWLGGLTSEGQGSTEAGLDGVVPLRRGLHGREGALEQDFVWASLVSPCDGEVQFNLELEQDLNFRENSSLFAIYCRNGDVKERYTSFGGRVVEFLNGKLETPARDSYPGPDLAQRFPVKKGELVLRILESYYPPIFESNLIAIPIFMPCTGRVAWGKQHRKLFVKGEQIVEFMCLEGGRVTSKHLISPSRGYTESLAQRDSSSKTPSLLDQGSDSNVITIGDPLGVMWLELSTASLSRERPSGASKETLVRMPCRGRLEYPISEASFVLKSEILYIVICQGSNEVVMEQSPVQGLVQLLEPSSVDSLDKDVYFLRLRPLDISEMPPLNRNPGVARHKFDLSLIREADPMSPIYIERTEGPGE